MNPASARSNVVLPEPLAPVSTSASPASTANDSPSMTRRAPALYDQVFSNELHSAEFRDMGDEATTEAFARNAAAATWRVSLLPAII